VKEVAEEEVGTCTTNNMIIHIIVVKLEGEGLGLLVWVREVPVTWILEDKQFRNDMVIQWLMYQHG